MVFILVLLGVLYSFLLCKQNKIYLWSLLLVTVTRIRGLKLFFFNSGLCSLSTFNSNWIWCGNQFYNMIYVVLSFNASFTGGLCSLSNINNNNHNHYWCHIQCGDLFYGIGSNICSTSSTSVGQSVGSSISDIGTRRKLPSVFIQASIYLLV